MKHLQETLQELAALPNDRPMGMPGDFTPHKNTMNMKRARFCAAAGIALDVKMKFQTRVIILLHSC